MCTLALSLLDAGEIGAQISASPSETGSATQTSSTPSFSRAVAFIGSMQACARNGTEYSASTSRSRGASAKALSTSPSSRSAEPATAKRILQRLGDRGAVGRIVGRAPLDLDRIGGIEGRPGVFGDDAEARAVGRVDRHDLDDARHLLGLRRFGLDRLRPEARAHLDRAVEHVGQASRRRRRSARR